jgi:hypothetical protein
MLTAKLHAELMAPQTYPELAFGVSLLGPQPPHPDEHFMRDPHISSPAVPPALSRLAMATVEEAAYVG